MTEDFIELIRREASMVVAQRQFNGTLVCTAYDPKRHMVKGMIMPHEVESGWVRIVQPHVGNGFGVAIGPKVGDPQKLDGDQFDLSFEFGDSNNIIAKHKSYSEQDVPPEVQSGEILVQHEKGTHVFIDKDGQLTAKHGPSGNTIVMATDKSITMTHKPTGSFMQIDKDGNQVHDPKDKTHTFKGKAVFEKDVTVEGVTELASGTLGGLGIATV